ncbi:hypothetical protein [Rubrivirga marina]|uniref:hypothetical protein n=1 Tax=Rubrivirga marina TaxID=1196024 RepID=UPI00117B7667|nr:hypothetical protein [Rubrivirga marina]
MSSTHPGPAATFRSFHWQTLKPGWIGYVTPQSYTAVMETCAGTKRYQIEAYPTNELSVELTEEGWGKAMDGVKAAVDWLRQTVGAAEVSFDPPDGTISVSAKWAEHDDHRAFYEYTASVELDPLLGGETKIHLGPLAALPGYIKKYVRASVYLKFQGGVSVTGSWGRSSPDEHSASAEASGYIKGAVGAELFLAHEKALEVTVEGGTGISLDAEASGAEPPSLEFGFNWDGVKGSVSVKIAAGYISYKESITLFDGGPLGKSLEYELPFG